MSADIGKDLYKLGMEKLEKKNILATRTEATRRLAEKSNIRACIINYMHSAQTRTDDDVAMHEETVYVPSWQKGVRERSNNLGLTF